jgi:hypothetical protein
MKHSLLIFQIIILLYLPNLSFSRTPLASFIKILKKYTTSDIVTFISECKTKHYKIIDPDEYLKKEDMIELEKQFKEIYNSHNVIPILVIARNIDLTDKSGKKIDISNYTEIVYDEIVEKKIVKNESSVILTIVSIEGKIMTMKALGKVSLTITQQDCYNILNVINNYYSYGEYSYGSVELSKLINYYLVNTGFFARNKRFFLMILILVLSFIFCYILALIAQKNQRKEKSEINNE